MISNINITKNIPVFMIISDSENKRKEIFNFFKHIFKCDINLFIQNIINLIDSEAANGVKK